MKWENRWPYGRGKEYSWKTLKFAQENGLEIAEAAKVGKNPLKMLCIMCCNSTDWGWELQDIKFSKKNKRRAQLIIDGLKQVDYQKQYYYLATILRYLPMASFIKRMDAKYPSWNIWNAFFKMVGSSHFYKYPWNAQRRKMARYALHILAKDYPQVHPPQVIMPGTNTPGENKLTLVLNEAMKEFPPTPTQIRQRFRKHTERRDDEGARVLDKAIRKGRIPWSAATKYPPQPDVYPKYTTSRNKAYAVLMAHVIRGLVLEHGDKPITVYGRDAEILFMLAKKYTNLDVEYILATRKWCRVAEDENAVDHEKVLEYFKKKARSGIHIDTGFDGSVIDKIARMCDVDIEARLVSTKRPERKMLSESDIDIVRRFVLDEIEHTSHRLTESECANKWGEWNYSNNVWRFWQLYEQVEAEFVKLLEKEERELPELIPTLEAWDEYSDFRDY